MSDLCDGRSIVVMSSGDINAYNLSIIFINWKIINYKIIIHILWKYIKKMIKYIFFLKQNMLRVWITCISKHKEYY